MISIVLADDHAILRQGVNVLLAEEPEFEVIAETGDGLEALQLTQSLRPDILVLDLEMPGLKGLEVLRQIQNKIPETHVVILSMHAKEAYVIEALRYGAMGYVLKGSNANELIQAIRQAAKGLRYLSPPLSERAVEAYMQKAQEQTLDPYDTLTNRERQVLYLAAEGFSSTMIGERLMISSRTVETHRAKMMHKLNLHNQTDLIRYAIQKGIIPLEEENSEVGSNK
jgi:DNA-binding NarL/FixJ family response regulator